MHNPLISVVLLTYNHEKFVAEAIQSTLNQTYQNFELIIVDNGSTDRTGDIAQSFKDARIRYHRQSNEGPSLGLNRGISLSTGEYIAFLSGDDAHHLNRLERQLCQAQEKRKDVLFSFVEFMNERSEKTEAPGWLAGAFNVPFHTQPEVLRKFYDRGNFLSAVSAFIKRSILVDLDSEIRGPFRPSYIQFQDYALWIQLVKKNEFLMVEEPLIKYRIIDDSGNLSAPTDTALNRGRIEHFLLSHEFFRGISDSFFTQAFSDLLIHKSLSLPYQRKIEEAFLFLKSPAPYLRLQGIHGLSELFNISEAARTLKDVYKWSALDFSKMLAREKIFIDFYSSTSLYLDFGEGFSEQNRMILKTGVLGQDFRFHFEFKEGLPISKLGWDPLEGCFCQVRIKEMFLVDSSGIKRTVDFKNLKPNGQQMDQDTWIFTHSDPRFVFDVNDAITEFEVNGSLKLLSYDEVYTLSQGLQKNTTLFVDTGQGFSEQQKVVHHGGQNAFGGKFDYIFDLSGFDSIRTLRWDPIEGEIGEFSIEKFILRECDDSLVEIDAGHLETNGKKISENTWLFLNSDPMFSFPVERKVKSLQIVGIGRILNSTEIFRVSILEGFSTGYEARKFKSRAKKALIKIRNKMRLLLK